MPPNASGKADGTLGIIVYANGYFFVGSDEQTEGRGGCCCVAFDRHLSETQSEQIFCGSLEAKLNL